MYTNKSIITNDELATGIDVATLLPIYMKINKLIYYKQWEDINTILIHIDIPRMSDTLLMGLLRLTLICKDHLNYWLKLYYAVKIHFNNKGSNVILPKIEN